MTTERLFNYVAKGYVIKQKNIGKPNDRNKLLSYGPFTVIIRTVKGANLAQGTRESSSRYVLNTGRSVISLHLHFEINETRIISFITPSFKM